MKDVKVKWWWRFLHVRQNAHYFQVSRYFYRYYRCLFVLYGLTGYYAAYNTVQQTNLRFKLKNYFFCQWWWRKRAKRIWRDIKQKHQFLLGSTVLPFLFHSLLKHGWGSWWFSSVGGRVPRSSSWFWLSPDASNMGKGSFCPPLALQADRKPCC